MEIYVCFSQLKKVQGGHPCGNAYVALREAGHDPKVHAVYGMKFPPLNLTPGRTKVKQLTGKREVPVMVTDAGEAIGGSKEIVAWARANPA